MQSQMVSSSWSDDRIFIQLSITVLPVICVLSLGLAVVSSSVVSTTPNKTKIIIIYISRSKDYLETGHIV